MKRAKVVVIGSLNMDVVVKANRPPVMGETVMGEKVHFIPGGKGGNQAVAAASLNSETWMIGAVGRDPFGQTLVSSLKEKNVHAQGVKIVEDVATGIASILLSHGDNSIIVVPGANSACSPVDVDKHRERIAEADVVLLQLEIPLPTIQHAVETAKSYGKMVILNPAPAQELPADLLRQVDYVTPNESELEMLTGVSLKKEGLEQAMNQLLHTGVGHVVTTLGREGAAILSPDKELVHIPAHVVETVDTTGAGDAFNAGLAVALAERKNLIEAVSFAGKVAALAVTRLGAQSGMPSRKEVDEWAWKQGGSHR